MRAGRWLVASLGVPHGGVDGRAGGVRSVQVGQQRAHVQGVGVPDEDLTEDRGVGGKQYAMPGRGGSEEREDVRGPRRGGEHDVGRVRPRERCRGEQDHRTAVYCGPGTSPSRDRASSYARPPFLKCTTVSRVPPSSGGSPWTVAASHPHVRISTARSMLAA